ncbi:hypothetical protein [Antarcticirhabdus aurantiaca]|uniref:Uncharacterized protein n=1 Tax=Antarcticirhabdus aurantiaca TaxID=2606717 RepID=A0ACD4NLQ5_9HYPH|nr:hypothetical protein [Antarcticirhabdus aurantiaca]WAJ27756.1 hypothetical protein OXU80_23400 [Jeongeuplla avenae]
MFVDFRAEPMPPPPPRPEPKRPRLTPGQQRGLAAIVGFNVLLLLLAPVGGATIVGALIALIG